MLLSFDSSSIFYIADTALVMGFSFRIRLVNALLLLSLICLDSGSAKSIITSAKSIRDPETVSSNNNTFILGFFSPQNSTNHYLGIWYLNESNVIWVANRNQPLRNSSGIFTISQDGNLVLLNGNKQVVWSSNVTNMGSDSATAQLLDTGNLILQNVNKEEIIWESFQHPTDTFVPKMKLSTNIITGKKVQITSWKSPSDPSNGSFSFSVEMLGTPELFIWNKTTPYWRSGPWNGREFLGISKKKPNHLYGITMDREEDGAVYVTFSFPHGTSDYAIFVMNPRGKVVEKDWKNYEESLNTIYPSNECDIYGFCGSFGTCNTQSSSICSCLKGFKPKITEEWSKQNWKSGCVRRAPLQCERVQDGGEVGKNDGFLKLEKTKVPDFAEFSSVPLSEDICRNQCQLNCSCKAYAYDAGIGCMTWSGDLVDIQRFTEGGTDLYIKVAYSELDKQTSMIVIAAVAFSAIVGTIIAATCSYFLWTWAFKYAGRKQTEHDIQRTTTDTKQYKLEELPLYDFKKVASATNNFHTANLLGRGGFGLVSKGKLEDGQEIAVKRLSKASGQGLQEFMNEVVVISKLQHRNLVRLLGCCVEGEEKMLIYEFMSNRSLDAYLFDPRQQKFLDWKKRINIIEGIARGLLYLHRDSRLRIIHRDLKASNILLDEEMNPKISDFGLAKIFKGNEEECNTARVVGTYGYMSPEYAMEGHFSEKSDVYSFGVLLLEIVSGKRSTSFYSNELPLSLIGYAWKLWNEENIKALIDPEISDPVFENQIVRCIHIGLLCVQELATERPCMTTVVSMLNSDIVNLPAPGQAAFVQKKNSLDLVIQDDQGTNLTSHVTLGEVRGR